MPDSGHVPEADDASASGTLRTLITSTPVTSGAFPTVSPATTVPLTVRPGPTASTVCSALSTAPPEAERNPKVSV
jgi:hypothetical protein